MIPAKGIQLENIMLSEKNQIQKHIPPVQHMQELKFLKRHAYVYQYCSKNSLVKLYLHLCQYSGIKCLTDMLTIGDYFENV